ncbi:DNA alkylation repair protein [Roseinatronobacter alkalisoli]|uniref:DNA alkylation repair protein n=1 Tax=Roseinatronobacter alkalisoli TaxID=3028235 RepID=A0ABT5T5A4_9RHOB|nr:DNA alkylation repair protein [Roseinatronobacter sp. HJB301]MDD7970305.1 DNA alkylation repair protein [Roseinatronobacter sp. HJB301]
MTETAAQLLAHLRTLSDPAKAAEMADYHKTTREFLGISAQVLDELARDMRRDHDVAERCAMARALWDSDIHEARILAAKLLTQARMRPDDRVAWDLIAAWAQDFDSWALADHAAIAGAKRLQADPARLAQVAEWITHPNMWTRRAALVMTLPWTRLPHPKPEDIAVREQVLGWAEQLVPDRDRFIQKAVAWWLRDLSRRNPDRVRQFLAGPGAALSRPAQREAARNMPPEA